MAIQPDQDPHATSEGAPVPGHVERERTDIRVVSFLGAVALVVVVGMWFYTKDKEMIAGDGTTVQHTTGSRAQDTAPSLPPRPVTPGLPASAPPQQ
jgi:hypothetical protein